MKQITIFFLIALLLIGCMVPITHAHAQNTNDAQLVANEELLSERAPDSDDEEVFASTHNYTIWDSFCENWLSITLAAITVTVIVGFCMISIHNSANRQGAAQLYMKEKGFYKVIDKDEIFEKSYTTTQAGYYKKAEKPSKLKK